MDAKKKDNLILYPEIYQILVNKFPRTNFDFLSLLIH